MVDSQQADGNDAKQRKTRRLVSPSAKVQSLQFHKGVKILEDRIIRELISLVRLPYLSLARSKGTLIPRIQVARQTTANDAANFWKTQKHRNNSLSTVASYTTPTTPQIDNIISKMSIPTAPKIELIEAAEVGLIFDNLKMNDEWGSWPFLPSFPFWLQWWNFYMRLQIYLSLYLTVDRERMLTCPWGSVRRSEKREWIKDYCIVRCGYTLGSLTKKEIDSLIGSRYLNTIKLTTPISAR